MSRDRTRSDVTDSSERKRAQLLTFVDRNLRPQAAVRAVVAIGSVAAGTARPDSDIDAYVFLEPLDLYLVPAESVWRVRDDTFHSILAGEPSLEEEGIQLDFHRVPLALWRSLAFSWPEHARAELADGRIVFGRYGMVEPLIASRTAYPAEARQLAIDAAVVVAAAELESSDEWPAAPAAQADRAHALQIAFDSLVDVLFAYNGRWLPWPNRRLRTLLRLPWLPADLAEHLMDAAVSSGHDRAAYRARAGILRRMQATILQQLMADGVYATDNPVGEAFRRIHDEPGRAWNMADWVAGHRGRAAGAG